jgi:hypothetical protein
MAHPVYRNANGDKMPSVTTILSRFKPSGALIAWANREGLEGRPIRGEGSTADKAMEAGTLAHARVEATIKGVGFPQQIDYPQEIWDKAESAFSAYREWSKQTRLLPCESEVSLTCECHQFGGTLDTILVQGKLSLGDIKTSNAVYAEYLCQLAAYKHLWEVNYPDKLITGGCHILRFSKIGGSFSHHFYPDLTVAWEAFELMRKLYDYDKLLKEIL